MCGDHVQIDKKVEIFIKKDKFDLYRRSTGIVSSFLGSSFIIFTQFLCQTYLWLTGMVMNFRILFANSYFVGGRYDDNRIE